MEITKIISFSSMQKSFSTDGSPLATTNTIVSNESTFGNPDGPSLDSSSKSYTTANSSAGTGKL